MLAFNFLITVALASEKKPPQAIYMLSGCYRVRPIAITYLIMTKE
jgi:hypothetical protein